MESGELAVQAKMRLFKCGFCPCIFLSQSDFQRHMDAFTDYQEIHAQRLAKYHQEWGT